MIFCPINKIKLILSVFFLFLSLSLIITPKIKAADVEFSCNSGGCSQIGAIFNENGIYPTQTIVKTLKVTNGFSETRGFALEVQNSNFFNPYPPMGDSLKVTITNLTDGGIVFGPESINQWKADGYKIIGDINPGDSNSKIYEFKVYFENVGNDYQNQKISFDLKLGFERLGTEATNTPAPTSSSPSNSISSSTSTNTSASNPTPAVLGLLTKIINPKPKEIIENLLYPSTASAPQILGTQCVKNSYPWWIFLLFEFLLFLSILRRGIINKWRVRKLMFWLVAIAVVSQIAHEITGCNCLTSFWCPKYIWINIVLLLLSTTYGTYKLRKD